MKIITVPHPTLRLVAQPVTVVDKKVKQFVVELQDTLAKKVNPKGVGLAAPQVNTKWRIFTTQLSQEGNRPTTEDDTQEEEVAVLRVFINPEIVDHSDTLTFGPDKKNPILEGCLSIPGLYGPVPRYRWIKIEYQEIVGDELVTRSERFSDFAARVVQHEYDHLDGILFIDHILKHGLPLYQEDEKTDKLIEIEESLVPAIVARTL